MTERISWRGPSTSTGPPTPSEELKVQSIYNKCPIPGLVIDKILSCRSDDLIEAFKNRLKLLQKKSTIPKFKAIKDQSYLLSPTKEAFLRKFDQLCSPHKEDNFPDVNILPAWHGTRSSIHDILQTGFVPLKETDSGYFGGGIYFSVEPEYSWKVYAKEHPLILTWVCAFATFPVLFEDQADLRGKSAKAGYDSHFVPVVHQGGDVYNALKEGQHALFHEIVVFDGAACLPSYTVSFRTSLPKEILPPPASPVKLSIEGGKEQLDDGQYLKAFMYFKELEKDPIHRREACWYLGYLMATFLYPKTISPHEFFDKTSSLPDIKAGERDPWTFFQLGLWFELKSDPDITRAIYLYSESGIPEAKYRCDRLSPSPQGDPPMPASKYPPTLYEMGKYFEAQPPLALNLRQSFMYYKNAALRNHPLAQYALACCYEAGRGTVMNPSKARQYKDKAAQHFRTQTTGSVAWELNDGETICALGDFFLEGLGGFAVNHPKAVYLYKQAAKKDGRMALFRLGTCYQKAWGVDKSIQMAYKYYYLASLHPSNAQQLAHLQMHSLLADCPNLQYLHSNLRTYADLSQ
eukprot:TRINITY_DN26003_c0_g1_i1.p1 TRINITY_DN26003_c0_g1~~TRINITY_DN26003_c0_g1_i1.p1  ORF type:complete len:576 (+),score=122.65 TRINITY_DN26003_c0_g1_i1:123-1850(+)